MLPMNRTFTAALLAAGILGLLLALDGPGSLDTRHAGAPFLKSALAGVALALLGAIGLFATARKS